MTFQLDLRRKITIKTIQISNYDTHDVKDKLPKFNNYVSGISF